MKIKKIYTHGRIFHSDEVTAIALLKLFCGFKGEVIRTTDENVIESAKKEENSLIIDIGGEYNGIKLFDHHQDKELLSSAGLIWKFINQPAYKKISELISMIDDQDRGIKKSNSFEFPNMITSLNGNPSDNDENFDFAVETARRVILSLKESQDLLNQAEEIVKNSEIKEGKDGDILFLSSFNRMWNAFVNGSNRQNVKRVVWFDKDQNKWKVQVPPLKPGKFELNGEKLMPADEMEFVHAAGFFAVAPSKEILESYLGL